MRIDLKKDRRDLYRPPSSEFVEVDVPAYEYLAVDGAGDPNTTAGYAAAVEALYTTGYAIRAVFKARTGSDFVVGPLEGLWWSANPSDQTSAFTGDDRSDWRWTMLIPLPAEVSLGDVRDGLTRSAAKKPHLPRAEIRRIHEGRCLQIMHAGPFSDEAPTLARLHEQVMPDAGLTFAGPHHEIYLSDPRRCAPEGMRTILRQPVRPVD
ncbi:GyrI-like domain-containing protein [Mobilicoccus massiliensis]|uniref:GyrI-like domain-containing protein n=1 Tax=Mobilicoccus massiliensis TaxID=1522310 RepID=UPI00059131FA|nr:GyrI-like domain-containing protein [Mobilicoccus massiliensis]